MYFNGTQISNSAPEFLEVSPVANTFSIDGDFDSTFWIASGGRLGSDLLSGKVWDDYILGNLGETLVLVTAQASNGAIYQKKVIMQINE
jgi:hypothetical protein